MSLTLSDSRPTVFHWRRSRWRSLRRRKRSSRGLRGTRTDPKRPGKRYKVTTGRIWSAVPCVYVPYTGPGCLYNCAGLTYPRGENALPVWFLRRHVRRRACTRTNRILIRARDASSQPCAAEQTAIASLSPCARPHRDARPCECDRSYLRMWVTQTREANSSHGEQETMHSEPDETFNEGRKRTLKKERARG